MGEQSTATKTKIKTSTKVVLGLLAVGSIVAGFTIFSTKPTATITTQYACKDSDNGINLFTSGRVDIITTNTLGSYIVSSSKDFCVSPSQVREFYCVSTSTHLFDSSLFLCEFGCKDRACFAPFVD